MNKDYTTKEEMQRGGIVDIELYKPGDPSANELYIMSTSGSLGNPLVLVRKTPPPQYRHLNMNMERRYIYVGSRRQAGLLLQYQLHHETNEFTCFLNKEEFDSVDPVWFFTELMPLELGGNPLAYLDVLRTAVQKHPPLRELPLVISVGSSILSPEALKEIQEMFPKATPRFRYYSSETAPASLGKSCPNIIKKYHTLVPGGCSAIHTPYEVEILEADEDGWGEVVLTTYHLNKYRTGDWGKFIPELCPCGETQTLLVRGRFRADKVICNGAIFHITEIERVMEKFSRYIKDMRIEVEEKTAPHTYGTVKLRIIPTKELKARENPETYIGELLAKELAVSKTKRLADLVERGAFEKPSVELLPYFPFGEKEIRVKKIVY